MGFRASAKKVVMPAWRGISKAHLLVQVAPMTGAYGDRQSALSAVPKRALAGYDHDEVVPVSLEFMSSLKDFDYPVLFWLDREMRTHDGPGLRILDAGGHVGTKFMAFRSHIDLSEVDWIVYDLPAMVAAGRRLAAANGLDDGLSFIDDVAEAGRFDVLLCSGLLQYLDAPFAEWVGRLPHRPATILLNKVALRDGAALFTLERIGQSYVPYQVRSERNLQQDFDTLGYTVLDRWETSGLTRRIASHPELGPIRHYGFLLRDGSARDGAVRH